MWWIALWAALLLVHIHTDCKHAHNSKDMCIQFYISLFIFKHTVKLLCNCKHCNSVCNSVYCSAFHLLKKPLYLHCTMKLCDILYLSSTFCVVIMRSNSLSVMKLVYMHHIISLILQHVKSIWRAHHFIQCY